MTLEEFIISHSEDDTSRLILGRDKWPDVDVPLAVNIIECRRKVRQKLPEWYAVPGLIYPDRICAEQSSSSFTANYKASVAGRILSSVAADGRRIADLTGGLGVDSLAFSAVADKVLYNEWSLPGHLPPNIISRCSVRRILLSQVIVYQQRTMRYGRN